MCPDHVDVRPFNEEETEVVLQSTLRGPFRDPSVPIALIEALSPSSYASPNSQVFPNIAIGSPNMWTAENSPNASIFPYMMNEAGEHLPISQYRDCKADTGVDQINGFVFVCDTGVEELQSPQGRYFYKDCKKYGSGAQVNGVEIVVHGSVRRAPAPPSLPGRWDGVNLVNAESRDGRASYKNQINGGRIRPMMMADMGMPTGSV
ncbi:hypothetical protein ACHAPX_003722 [Trichoderma viride]|jgi:hypothetical protein